MNWRLGLDLGTNSIGWSVFSLDENKEPNELVDLGVRIFSDGRNPKSKEPLAVERRTARGQRKIIYRRKLRRKATFKLLQKQGLFPLKKEDAQNLKLLNPYELRVAALDRKLEPAELGRVLFNLSVRRGFKSNRKDGSREEVSEAKSSNKTNLSQSDMCNNLEQAVEKSGYRTLGEFLWKNKDENAGIRFVPGRTDYYPTRKLYEEEFTLIKTKQIEYYPSLDWEAIYIAIFDQRPLRAQQRGKCLYMPEKDRTYKGMPCAQKIRILQEVRNLKYYDENKVAHPIEEEQENLLLSLLDTKEKLTFDQMRKALKLSDGCIFNLEENRDELKGNSTAVKMRSKNRFGSSWDTMSLDLQDKIIEILITAEEDKEVEELLKEFELSEEQKNFIVKTVLPTGTTMLSKEASELIVGKMISVGAGCDYTSAVQSLGFKYADQTVLKTDIMPYYGKILTGSTVGGNPAESEDNPEKKYGKISNPTVHVALNQTKVIVNALIKEYGKPAQISVELSRDLKSSRESKLKILKKQTEQKKINIQLNEDLSSIWKISYPNRNDRLKYRLWKELDHLGHKCIYCGKELKATELFTNNIQIEHILPYSRTLLDAESNLTVAHASCNAYKKEQSPFEAFGNSPSGYNWDDILYRANLLKNPSKKNKFAMNAMDAFDKESGFVARQLTDNAYLSKMALRYLHCICDDVWSVNGGMTKLLRDKWEMDSILSRKIGEKEAAAFGLTGEQISEFKKNRKDHRHHAVDAFVIALIDRSLVKKISTLNARSMKNRIEVPQLNEFIMRPELIEKVKHIVVSFKPDHGAEGKLSKETLLGKIKREELVDIKNLSEDDVRLIKTERVRNEIVSKLNELGDIKKVQKEFKDIYPQVRIFKEYFVARTSITSLKTEKDVETIVDEKIRNDLKAYIDAHKTEKIEISIQHFSEERRIFKVRCMNRVQTPIEINSSAVPRYLCPDDYFAAVIWEIPAKKDGGNSTYEAQYIRRDQAGKDNKPKKEVLKAPHPAAKNIGIIYKGDYLEFTDKNVIYKCRVAGYSASRNNLDIRPIYAVTDCAEWLYATNENMIEYCWKPQKGQNFISVNVLFGEKKARFVTVNPIGRVFRKK